jgi:hypothetical protein
VESFNQIESQTGLRLGARKAVFLLAAFLVLVNGQCVATCSATECSHPASQARDSSKLPPCHQHSEQKQSTVAKPCVDSVVVVEGRSSAHSLERHSIEPLAAASGAGSNQPLSVLTARALLTASPPIPVEARSILILRI